MSTYPSLLCVDDDPDILSAMKRQLHMKYKVFTANDGVEGLSVLSDNKHISVVISDMRMPKMNGATFLTKVKERSPHTVRILLTGQSDIDAAIDAINDGEIFRFLMKPCEQNELLETIDTAVNEHQLLTLEDDLLNKTLYGSTGLIDLILHSVQPIAHRIATRIQSYVVYMATELKLSNVQQYQSAAALAMLGCLNLSNDKLEKIYSGTPRSDEDYAALIKHLTAGWNLVAKISNLKLMRQIILQLKEGYVHPDLRTTALEPDFIHISAAQLIHIAIEFDHALALSGSAQAAIESMRAQHVYDEKVLAILQAYKLQSNAH